LPYLVVGLVNPWASSQVMEFIDPAVNWQGTCTCWRLNVLGTQQKAPLLRAGLGSCAEGASAWDGES